MVKSLTSIGLLGCRTYSIYDILLHARSTGVVKNLPLHSTHSIKSFDTVVHTKLLLKLSWYGFFLQSFVFH